MPTKTDPVLKRIVKSDIVRKTGKQFQFLVKTNCITPAPPAKLSPFNLAGGSNQEASDCLLLFFVDS
jgi:hypothetical protein